MEHYIQGPRQMKERKHTEEQYKFPKDAIDSWFCNSFKQYSFNFFL